MPSGRYKFVRDNVRGFLSSNRPSKDALSAVSIWSSTQPQRSYDTVVNEDEQLLADISWRESDVSAGQDLDENCRKFGVEYSFVQT